VIITLRVKGGIGTVYENGGLSGSKDQRPTFKDPLPENAGIYIPFEGEDHWLSTKKGKNGKGSGLALGKDQGFSKGKE